MSAKSLPDCFHGIIAVSIGAEGVYPHQCYHRKNGEATLSALALNRPIECYAYVAGIIRKDKPDELIFGLDRFCKEGQGTTLKDCIGGAHWDGILWTPFIIEYQHEPRIVKPIDWQNECWNRFITSELRILKRR